MVWPIRRIPLLRRLYPRGWSVRSEEFVALGIGGLALEFFPNGSLHCRKQGFCSLQLHGPTGSYLRLEFYAGDDTIRSVVKEHRFSDPEAPPGVADLRLLERAMDEEVPGLVVAGVDLWPADSIREARHGKLDSWGVLDISGVHASSFLGDLMKQ